MTKFILSRYGELVSFDETILKFRSYGFEEEYKYDGDFELITYDYEHKEQVQRTVRNCIGKKIRITLEVIDD